MGIEFFPLQFISASSSGQELNTGRVRYMQSRTKHRMGACSKGVNAGGGQRDEGLGGQGLGLGALGRVASTWCP